MKALKTKGKTRLVEPEQGSYPVYCIESGKKGGWQSLINGFFDYQRGVGRAASTVESHTINLQYWTQYIKPLKIKDPCCVTPQVVAGYQTYIYQYRTRFGRPFAIQSQVGILNSLQVFYKYLIKTGHVLSNPTKALKLPKQRQRLPGTILSSKEMKRLLNQPDTGTVLGFRDRTMYEVLYSTGLRVGELTGMRVQDLDFSQGTLFVPENKRCADRIVPMGDTAHRYLDEYLERIRPTLARRSSTCHGVADKRRRESEDGYDLPSSSALNLVFLSRLNRRLDMSGVQLKLRIYAERAGIKKHVTPHIFRHTLATDMLRRGADLRQIQELLGHKNLRTTQIYTHVFKGELKRIQAHCHPREQTDLPDGFTVYRGRDYLTDDEKKQEKRSNK